MPVNSQQVALVESLRSTLCDVFAMYVRAHAAHWNVEGPSFPSLHEFFGEIYQDVYSSIDPLAEFLRTHQAEAPCSVGDFAKESNITDLEAEETNSGGYGAKDLVENLNAVNVEILVDLRKTYTLAEKSGDLGLANFLQDRMIAHRKWQWQLRSTLQWME